MEQQQKLTYLLWHVMKIDVLLDHLKGPVARFEINRPATCLAQGTVYQHDQSVRRVHATLTAAGQGRINQHFAVKLCQLLDQMVRLLASLALNEKRRERKQQTHVLSGSKPMQ